MSQAKRVVLRLRENELNDTDPYESVRLYLEKDGRSGKELEEGRHFIHMQPSNPDIPQEDPKIHIIIDIEKDQFSGALGQDFPYEVYRVRRLDGEMKIFAFRDGVWYNNFVRKLRAIIDDIYPWGATKHNPSSSGSVGSQIVNCSETPHGGHQ